MVTYEESQLARAHINVSREQQKDKREVQIGT